MLCSSVRVFNPLIIAQRILLFPSKPLSNSLQISSIYNPIGSKRPWFSTRFGSNNKTPVLGLRSMATQSKQSVYDFSVKVCESHFIFRVL